MPRSAQVHSTFCTLDELVRPQIFSIAPLMRLAAPEKLSCDGVAAFTPWNIAGFCRQPTTLKPGLTKFSCSLRPSLRLTAIGARHVIGHRDPFGRRRNGARRKPRISRRKVIAMIIA